MLHDTYYREIEPMAECMELGAIYAQGKLIIQAIGMAPSAQHTVRIVRSPLTIFPPEFRLVLSVEAGAVTTPGQVPYVTTEAFFLPPVERVIIHHSDGAESVDVVVAEEAEGPFAQIAAQGERDIPMPYFLPQGTAGYHPVCIGQIASAPNTPELLPIRQRVEAVGYSDGFSFDEAFRDAVQRLPDDPHAYPDKMTTITVTEVGAVTGGIAAIAKMYVKVAANY